MILDLRRIDDTTQHPSARLLVMVEGAALCLTMVGRSPADKIRVYNARECTMSYSREMDVVYDPKSDNSHWVAEDRAEQFGLCLAFRYTKSILNMLVDRVPINSREFDYYLADVSSPLELTAVLEVSGIERGSTSQLRGRVKSKIERIVDKGTDDIPWFVIVGMAQPLEMCVVSE